MTMTAPPTAPSRGDSDEEFDDHVDAYHAWQAINVAEINTALASINMTKWISGTTYAVGDVTWSPIDYLAYRRKTAGAGTTDPSADSTNWALASEPIDPALCEGRLTLTTGVPVTTSDVTAAETLYFTPYKGNQIALFDGTRWQKRTFSELSIDVPDATNCYDVFVYDNAGTPALELTAWTNETTRATALASQNGVLSKTGALTRRYLGTFYSTTAGNGQIEDSMANRYLWNYYNRVRRPMRCAAETTDTWSYTTAALRQANANTANQLNFVVGVSEDAVTADVVAALANTNAAVDASVAIGLDATNAMASGCLVPYSTTEVANGGESRVASWKGFPGVGRHFLAWLEFSVATGTTTWVGDVGAPTRIQSGIHGEVFA